MTHPWELSAYGNWFCGVQAPEEPDPEIPSPPHPSPGTPEPGDPPGQPPRPADPPVPKPKPDTPRPVEPKEWRGGLAQTRWRHRLRSVETTQKRSLGGKR
jgi:hypothetical protein